MARVLYRMLRAANVIGTVDEPKIRAAMNAPTFLESIAKLTELDKPLSYALPFTGNAMEPLLNAGTGSSSGRRDTVVIRHLNPVPQNILNRVHVNDVVVIQDPSDSRRKYVRRIAALEGAEMSSEAPGDEPFRIPADHCWVLRENEKALEAPDSRFFGPLGLQCIIGRVMYAIRSATDHGRVVYSPVGMATDELVLRQPEEAVAPFIDAHSKRTRNEAAAAAAEAAAGNTRGKPSAPAGNEE